MITIIKEIGYTIAKISGLGELIANGMRTMVSMMLERRLVGAGGEKRGYKRCGRGKKAGEAEKEKSKAGGKSQSGSESEGLCMNTVA